MTSIISAITQFFYPSFCQHCNNQTFGKDKWICKICFDQIEWIETDLSCQTCGKPKRDRKHVQCKSCQKKAEYLMPYSACFFPEGPAYSLHGQLRVYESEDIAKTFAALLVMKWKKMGWPFPDAIIPIPSSRLETLLLKRQPSYLITKALSKLLSTSFKPVLTTREKGSTFSYHAKTFLRGNFTDQKVLLITDMVNTSEAVRLAKDATEALFPKAIYTLALFDRRL